MSRYAMFMKQFFFKNKRLEEFEIVALNEECCVVLQRKFPKMKDLGRLLIHYSMGLNFLLKVVRELSASINLILLSIYKKFGLG